MARIIQPNSFSLIFLFYRFARKVNMGMIYFLVMLHGAIPKRNRYLEV